MYCERKAQTSVKIEYDRTIRDISRKCDVFYIHRNIGQDTETDYRGAICALVGIYCHFLKSGGRIRKSMTVAGNPSNICRNITIDETESGRPALSMDETRQCISDILEGLYRFHDRKCRKYDVAQGMGLIIRKLYEPYRNSDDMEIHELFYAVIARGTFVLQMNNEIMARAFYKGLYEAWSFAANKQQYFFGENFWDAQVCYDNLLSHESVEEDPIHDGRKYPWNLYRFNVDNIILTHCAAKEFIDAADKNGFMRKEDLRQYRQVMDLSNDFFKRVAAFYRVRCDYFNNRSIEGVEEGRDPVEVYGNVQHTLEDYESLSMDYAPYIFYSCRLIQSTEDRSSWIYQGIAKNYAGKEYGDLDAAYSVFSGRDGNYDYREWPAKAGMTFFVIGFISVIFVTGIVAVVEWESRTHFIARTAAISVVLLIYFAICMLYGLARAS